MNAASLKQVARALLVATLVLPAVAFASSEQPFGGREVLVFGEDICDCSGTNVHFLMDDTNSSDLTLYYPPGARTYENNNVDNIGGFQLGSYSEGAEPCMMEVGPDCVEVETPMGEYGSAPGTGTSMLDSARTFAANIQHFINNLPYGKA